MSYGTLSLVPSWRLALQRLIRHAKKDIADVASSYGH